MKLGTSAAVLALVFVTATGCRSATPGAPAVPAVDESSRQLPDAIRWVRDGAEYRAAALQTYRTAAAWVDEAGGSREAGTWAVVLDADETVISNLQYQIERARAGLPFTPESWKAWVARREAVPIPGAARFLVHVRDRGGRVAIVTNRLESECPDTEALFRALALHYDVMLCRPDNGPSDKNPRFLAVAQGTTAAGGPPLDVVAFIGDNIHDFPELSQALARQDEAALAEFGRRYFILPNPMYGSWQ